MGKKRKAKREEDAKDFLEDVDGLDADLIREAGGTVEDFRAKPDTNREGVQTNDITS